MEFTSLSGLGVSKLTHKMVQYFGSRCFKSLHDGKLHHPNFFILRLVPFFNQLKYLRLNGRIEKVVDRKSVLFDLFLKMEVL